MDTDVLVVGGGPAGASVATALARRGVDVLLIDRARFPRPKPCAEYLSPQATRILTDLGAAERLEAGGAALLSGMRIRAPNGATIRGEFRTVAGHAPFRDRAFSVRREILDAVLLDCARGAGVRIAERVRAVDLIRDAGRTVGVSVLAASGDSRERRALRARVVIGADGLRSVVAHRLGVSRVSRWPRRIALVTHYAGVRDVDSLGEMHVERDGFVGIADVGGGVTTVALVVPARHAKRFTPDRGAFLERWLAAKPHLAARFASAMRVSPVTATGPFASHARRAWDPGAALVGDAADFFDPFTGEGIYAALRGGEMLSGHVADALSAKSARAADDRLAAYDSSRRAEFGGKWLVERIIGTVVGTPLLINRAARSLSRRRDLADLLFGVTGNFVPPREVIRLDYLWAVFGNARARVAHRAIETA